MKNFAILGALLLAPAALAGGGGSHIIYTPASGDSPFSDSVQVGGLLFVSGKLGTDDSGDLVSGGVQAETRQTIRNIETALQRRGYTLRDLVKCTVMLTDMNDFDTVNTIYRQMIPQPLPARSALGVRELALNATVEIECIAAR